jgi:hypothetical protein
MERERILKLEELTEGSLELYLAESLPLWPEPHLRGFVDLPLPKKGIV